MEANPYSTPVADLYGTNTSGGDIVSGSSIAQLAGTKGWVRFMSVMMWLLALLYLVMALIFFLTGNAAFAQLNRNSPAMVGQLFQYGIPALYGLFGFVCMYPAVKMWKYASAIGRLMASHSIADLDAALAHQRRFWKFTGIITILSICLFVVFVIGMAAMGASMAKAAGAIP